MVLAINQEIKQKVITETKIDEDQTKFIDEASQEINQLRM